MAINTDTAFKKAVKNAIDKANGKIGKVACGEGLIALCRPSGTITFVFRYRFPKEKTLTLGKYRKDKHGSGLSLGDAKELCRQHKKTVEQGIDPSVEKRLNVQQNKEAATVRDVVNLWVQRNRNSRKDLIENAQGNSPAIVMMEKHILRKHGDLPIDKLTLKYWKEEVFRVDDTDNPEARRKCLTNMKTALRLAIEEGNCTNGDLLLLKPTVIKKPLKTETTERPLTMDEIADVIAWTQSQKSNRYYAAFTLLCLVFGCRGNELRQSRVKEWDFEEMVWTVPPQHNKVASADRSYEDNCIYRPIPERLAPYIKRIIAGRHSDEFFLGEEKQQSAVSKHGTALSQKLGHTNEGANAGGWSNHDLRRSIASHMNADGGGNFLTIESLLGHRIKGVASRYVKGQNIEAKRKLLDDWLDKIGIE